MDSSKELTLKQLYFRIKELNTAGKIKITPKGKVECEDAAVLKAFEKIPAEITAKGYDSVVGYLRQFFD